MVSHRGDPESPSSNPNHQPRHKKEESAKRSYWDLLRKKKVVPVELVEEQDRTAQFILKIRHLPEGKDYAFMVNMEVGLESSYWRLIHAFVGVDLRMKYIPTDWEFRSLIRYEAEPIPFPTVYREKQIEEK